MIQMILTIQMNTNNMNNAQHLVLHHHIDLLTIPLHVQMRLTFIKERNN